jgi:hypothetical protein
MSVALASAQSRSGGSGKARLHNATSPYNRRVLGMRHRPAGDFILARKPHAFSLAHILQNSVQHSYRGRHAAHAIMCAYQGDYP